MEQSRRHFLGSVLGLAASAVASPIIKPKRSLFFFGKSYRLDRSLIKYQLYPPYPDQDTGKILSATLQLKHIRNGKEYDGFWASSVQATPENLKEKKESLYLLIENLMRTQEIDYCFERESHAGADIKL